MTHEERREIADMIAAAFDRNGTPARVIDSHPFRRSIRCEVCGQNQTNSIHPTPPKECCVRCGAPYLSTGQCSHHAAGCQGGRGESSSPTAWETAKRLANEGKVHMYCCITECCCGKPEAHAIHGYTGA